MEDREKDLEKQDEELTEELTGQESEELTEEGADEEIEVEVSEEGEEAEETEEPKKGFFGKAKKEKKDKKDIQIEELTDKYKRTMAEFDNFRKRTEKEKTQMYEVGAKEVIEKILPVIDNFERGLATLSEEEKTAPFAEGMDKIYRQMMTCMEELGVKPIDAVGNEFNPDFHNAVMQVESEEFEEGTVAQELQKGYMYKDYVVRHSMVSVAQ